MANFLKETFLVQKTDVAAVLPFKNDATDVGWDLTLIRKLYTTGQLHWYDTCLRIKPNDGWYFDVVARSSLQKAGYMLGNNVGVIDPTYRGNILVCLFKFDPDEPDLPLPFRAVQLIARPVIQANYVEVESLSETERGANGFGSTGV